MLDRVQEIADGRVTDIVKVAVPNTLVLALVKLIDIKTVAELTLIVLSIGYTIWRWRRDAKKG